MSYFASMRSKMGDLKDKLSDRQKKAGLLAGDDEKVQGVNEDAHSASEFDTLNLLIHVVITISMCCFCRLLAALHPILPVCLTWPFTVGTRCLRHS
jgi:hypothetical protein